MARLIKPHIQIYLLGRFVLNYEGQPVYITSQRLQGLLAYLALHRHEIQPRQRLAFLIWPDTSESQAHTNLRTVLHRLQSTLPNLAQLIQIEPQTIAWQSSVDLWSDVEDFETALALGDKALQSGDNTSACQALEDAVACYDGDLLPNFYDEWVLSKRERLQSLLFNTLDKLVSLLEQSHSYTAAISYARRLVSLDPLNEAAYLRLMNLHVINGERASGLRVYHSCASILHAELGITPGKALTAAYEKLLAVELAPANKPSSLLLKSPTELIGRDRELQQIQAVIEVAMAGQPRMLILSGEAGIGKTRLAEELLRWANRQGLVSASAPCYAAEGDLAFAPITIMLRSDGLRASLQRLDTEWLSDISRIAPDLFVGNPNVHPPGPLTEQWQRQRLFEALARAVLSTQRSTILLIDDLQWCSRDTVEWLHFLLRFETTTRLLVVGTVRLEEVESNQALTEMLNLLRSEARLNEIVLSPLSIEDTTALGANVLGSPLSPEEADILFAETEGNPLFVLETLRATALGEPANSLTERIERSNVTALPSKIQAVIERRLNQLTIDTRKILDAAAVIGRSFTFDVLAQATDIDEAALVIGLDELWQRRVLCEQGLDSYDFSHDKLRSVAYINLRLAQRKILHRRVAQALEIVYQDELDLKSGQIAVHYEAAGKHTQAAYYYQRAAQYARQLYANDIALNNYENALRVLDSHSKAEQSAVFEQMGDLLHLLGRYTEARDAWQRALEVNANAEPVNRAHLYRKLGNAWRDQDHYDKALAIYDTAESLLDDQDNSDLKWLCWVQIKLERMSTVYWLGDATQIFQLIDQVHPILEQRGSLAQRAKLHHVTIMALLRRDRYLIGSEGIEHARAYLKMLLLANDVASIPAARFQLAGALLFGSTNWEEAISEYNNALEFAEKSGDVSLQSRCLSYMTIALRRQQKLEQVRIFAERSLEIASEHQMSNYVGAAYANLAWLEWKSDNVAVAHQYGIQAFDAWQKYPIRYVFEWIARLPLMALALAEGEITEAHSHAQMLLDQSQQRMPSEIEMALQEADKADDSDSAKAWLSIAIQKSIELKYL